MRNAKSAHTKNNQIMTRNILLFFLVLCFIASGLKMPDRGTVTVKPCECKVRATYYLKGKQVHVGSSATGFSAYGKTESARVWLKTNGKGPMVNICYDSVSYTPN